MVVVLAGNALVCAASSRRPLPTNLGEIGVISWPENLLEEK